MAYINEEYDLVSLDVISRVVDEEYKSWFLIPFIPKLTEKFKNITKMLKISVFQLTKVRKDNQSPKGSLTVKMH